MGRHRAHISRLPNRKKNRRYKPNHVVPQADPKPDSQSTGD